MPMGVIYDIYGSIDDIINQVTCHLSITRLKGRSAGAGRDERTEKDEMVSQGDPSKKDSQCRSIIKYQEQRADSRLAPIS